MKVRPCYSGFVDMQSSYSGTESTAVDSVLELRREGAIEH